MRLFSDYTLELLEEGQSPYEKVAQCCFCEVWRHTLDLEDLDNGMKICPDCKVEMDGTPTIGME